MIINGVPVPAWAAWLCAVLATSGAFAWCWVACWALARAVERWWQRRQDGGEDAEHEDMWARMRGELVHEETRRILADDWLPRERDWPEITGQQTVIPPGHDEAGRSLEMQAAALGPPGRPPFGRFEDLTGLAPPEGGHTPPGGGHVVVMGSGHYSHPYGPAGPPVPWSPQVAEILAAAGERLAAPVVAPWIEEKLGHLTVEAALDSICAKAARDHEVTA
jgi:hypothetical protein